MRFKKIEYLFSKSGNEIGTCSNNTSTKDPLNVDLSNNDIAFRFFDSIYGKDKKANASNWFYNGKRLPLCESKILADSDEYKGEILGKCEGTDKFLICQTVDGKLVFMEEDGITLDEYKRSLSKEKNATDNFKRLKSHENNRVLINGMNKGILFCDNCVLDEVKFFDGVSTKSGDEYQFISDNAIILSIVDYDSLKVLYEMNLDISKPYNTEVLKRQEYGDTIVDKQINRANKKRTLEREKRIRDISILLYPKKEILLKKGLSLLDSRYHEEWKKFVESSFKEFDFNSWTMAELVYNGLYGLVNNFPFEDIDEELDSSHITEDKLIEVVNKIGHFSKDVGKKFQKKYYDDHHLSYFDYDEEEDLVLSLSD